MQWARCEKASAESEEEKKRVFRDISKHNIIYAFCLPNMPLSDLIHGIYKMSPPELLHTSGSGLIKYVFSSVRARLTPESQRSYNDLHCLVSSDVSKQSKTKFPRGTDRTSPLDGTKSHSIENDGNFFRFGCIANI